MIIVLSVSASLFLYIRYKEKIKRNEQRKYCLENAYIKSISGDSLINFNEYKENRINVNNCYIQFPE